MIDTLSYLQAVSVLFQKRCTVLVSFPDAMLDRSLSLTLKNGATRYSTLYGRRNTNKYTTNSSMRSVSVDYSTCIIVVRVRVQWL